jgi:hypothetical protein
MIFNNRTLALLSFFTLIILFFYQLESLEVCQINDLKGAQARDIWLRGFYLRPVGLGDLGARPKKNPNLECLGLKIANLCILAL